VVIAGWISLQVIAAVRAALPWPPPWSAKLPWEMFRVPPAVDHELRALVRVGDAWEPVALDRWFSYSRGATGERATDNHPIFFDPARSREREVFARWVMARLIEDGRRVDELRLVRRSHDLRSGLVREHAVGRYTP